jgi:hypothetical protein
MSSTVAATQHEYTDLMDKAVRAERERLELSFNARDGMWTVPPRPPPPPPGRRRAARS